MPAITILEREALSVIDYRCDARVADRPAIERHGAYSLAYVRKGSFGYRARGEAFELVAGSVLVGHRGDEYVCTHDHVCGDECLSIQLAPALAEALAEVGAGRAPSPLGETERFELVLGITCHAVYHAGQIQLVKRLLAA